MSKDLETAIIRNPYKKMSMSEQQIIEFARCADPVTGPRYFMSNYFYIQHPTKGAMQYKPFEYQERLIDSYHENRFSISLMPRQTGKSTSAAGYLLWYAMFVPDSTILVAAHKYIGAQEIMQRVRYAYENCPDFIRAGVTSYNKGSLDFENGSRIVSQTTTENTGRGMSISLLYCDEFAFVPPNIAKEFWTSISPTLATGGKAIITSTPNSDEDQFAEIWFGANRMLTEEQIDAKLGDNGFHAYTSHWSEHPDRDDEWMKQEMGRIGEERFRREYGCEFLIYDETLINSISLSGLEGIDPKLRMGQVRWYKDIDPKQTYIVALDPALGTGGNYAAIEIVAIPSFEQVGEWNNNLTPVQAQARILRDICKYINDECQRKSNSPASIYYSAENNTLGEAALIAIQEIGEESIPGMFLSEPIKKGHVRRFRKGFNTTNVAKLASCAKLKHLIEHKTLKIYSKLLISELKAFIAAGTAFEAKVGQYDDLVSATLLATRMIMMLQDWDPAVYEKFNEHPDDADLVMPMPVYISSVF